MIKGQAKTEAVYRAILLDSSSSLKEFSMDRKKYYNKYYLGKNVEDKDSQAAIMGRIVETLLMEPDEFDKRFYMSVICEITIQTPAESLDGYFNIQTFLFSYIGDVKDRYSIFFILHDDFISRAGDSPVSYQRSMRLSIHNDSKQG